MKERLKLDWEQFDRDQRRSFDRQLLRARLDTPTSRTRTPARGVSRTTRRIDGWQPGARGSHSKASRGRNRETS